MKKLKEITETIKNYKGLPDLIRAITQRSFGDRYEVSIPKEKGMTSGSDELGWRKNLEGIEFFLKIVHRETRLAFLLTINPLSNTRILLWFGIEGHKVFFASQDKAPDIAKAQEEANKYSIPTIFVDPEDVKAGKSCILPGHINYAMMHILLKENLDRDLGPMIAKINKVVETGIFLDVLHEGNWTTLDARHLIPHFNPKITICYPEKKDV